MSVKQKLNVKGLGEKCQDLKDFLFGLSVKEAAKNISVFPSGPPEGTWLWGGKMEKGQIK